MGDPILFIAGEGKRGVGWEEGCLGMRIGETRKLWVPSHEGYGARGSPELEIPPHCDLEFTIDCVDIAGSAGCRKYAKLDCFGNEVPDSSSHFRYPSSSTSTRLTCNDAGLEQKLKDAVTPALDQKALDAEAEWLEKCKRSNLENWHRGSSN